MPPTERCSAVKDKLRPTKSTETSTPADEGKVVNESWRWRGTTTRHGIATDGRYDRIRTMLRPVDPTEFYAHLALCTAAADLSFAVGRPPQLRNVA